MRRQMILGPRLVCLFTLIFLASFYSSQLVHAQLVRVSDDQSAGHPELQAAADLISQAKAKGAAEHKNVMLVFSASWCQPCHLYEAFLEDKKISPIIEKYFVMQRIGAGEEQHGNKPWLNNPGSEQLMATYSGVPSAGFPLIVFLNPQGDPVVNSLRPVAGGKPAENIGYPYLPVEVDWYMTMLQKAVPEMSRKDVSTIRNWLHDHGGN